VGSSILDVSDDSLKVKNKDKTRGHQIEEKEGDFNTKSVGLHYKWSFTSLASKKLMPYDKFNIFLDGCRGVRQSD